MKCLIDHQAQVDMQHEYKHRRQEAKKKNVRSSCDDHFIVVWLIMGQWHQQFYIIFLDLWINNNISTVIGANSYVFYALIVLPWFFFLNFLQSQSKKKNNKENMNRKNTNNK